MGFFACRGAAVGWWPTVTEVSPLRAREIRGICGIRRYRFGGRKGGINGKFVCDLWEFVLEFGHRQNSAMPKLPYVGEILVACDENVGFRNAGKL